MKYISAWDFILVPLYLFLAFVVARATQNNKLQSDPDYKYYLSGLFAKLFGGLGLAFVYTFYYNGGDTIEFWRDCMVYNSLMFHDFACWLRIMGGSTDLLWFWCFDPYETGIPYYYNYDSRSHNVPRFLNLLTLFTASSYYALTILTAWASYPGVWRLFKVLSSEYPELRKQMAISVLFVPSVFFWGSGVMKDTLTFSAACWFTVGMYKIVLKRNAVFGYIIVVILSTYVMISIRPYIFVALMPGVVIWVLFNQLKRVDNKVVKFLIAPIIGLTALGIIAFVMSRTSSSLGDYGSMDQVLNKAVATQQDLKRDAYKGNSFDIGTFDASIGGILSKLPAAVWAGLFRPTFLDVNNIVMLISAIENTILLFFFLRVFFRAGPMGFFRSLSAEPTALFAMTFAIFFAFSVGLTTANFGSLVRYKIPSVPFFLAGLYITEYLHRKNKLEGLQKEQDKLESAKAAAGFTNRPKTGSI